MKIKSSFFLSRAEIIRKMNHFSGRGEPFVFAIDSDGENGFVLTPEEADNNGILYDFRNGEKPIIQDKKRPELFEIDPVDFLTYRKAFEKVKYHLARGDSYLLNLTFPTRVVTDCSPEEIFHISQAPFKMFVPGWFVVFSPEIFVRIREREIISCPMKGTIDASLPDARERLLANDKEFFEHNTIVDLIRNDLSMVSTGVKVKRFRYLELIKTNRGDLWQMSSEICGTLPEDFMKDLGGILFTLLPAGSVTGAPKERTVQIIRETENYERGFYTGIFGYFDGSSLLSAVSIRYIEETGSGLVFKSGGGITALSEAQDEYQEMIKKVYVPVV